MRLSYDKFLQKSEQLLEITFGAAKMGRLHIDFRTNELISSAACKANFGRAPDDLFTFEDLKETVHPDDRESVRESFWEAVRNRDVYQIEHRVIWPDGSVHWMASHGRSAYGHDGQPSYLDGVVFDFTERKQMEESLRRQAEALQEADHRKDDFLATLSHELRNPLAPLRNAVHILALQMRARRRASLIRTGAPRPAKAPTPCQEKAAYKFDVG